MNYFYAFLALLLTLAIVHALLAVVGMLGAMELYWKAKALSARPRGGKS